METNINNTILLKFHEHPNFDNYDSEKQDYILKNCNYNSSWESLMLVCREILSKNDDEGLEYALSNGHSAPEVYKQVIRFIKERNEIIKKSKDLGIKCK